MAIKTKQEGNKRTYICGFPDYIPKKKDPDILKDLAQDSEFNEIAERRQLQRHIEMKSIQPDHDLVVYKTLPVIADYSPSLFKQKVRSCELKKIRDSFINSHPLRDAGYTDIPIYFNMNGNEWYDEETPYILGYLKGFYKDKKGNVFCSIEPVITNSTHKWIFRAHINFRLKVASNGTLYINTLRLWDNSIKHAKHPITGQPLTEDASLQITTLLENKEKTELCLEKYTNRLEEYLELNKTLVPGTKDYTTNKKVISKLQNKILIYQEVTLPELKDKIDTFYFDHLHDNPDDEQWSVKWEYLTYMQPIVKNLRG